MIFIALICYYRSEMKGKRNNNRRRISRRNGRSGRPSEGLGRKSSVIISNQLEIPVGVSGAQFTVEELLRKYFQEPRLVKIYQLKIKLQPLNINTPFYQVQAFATLDEPGSQLVALTHIVQGSINSRRMSITIAQPRRFWVLDKRDDFTFLDLRFQTFANCQLMCEVETYFHIEIDELTPLSLKTLTLLENDSGDEGIEVIEPQRNAAMSNFKSHFTPTKKLMGIESSHKK